MFPVSTRYAAFRVLRMTKNVTKCHFSICVSLLKNKTGTSASICIYYVFGLMIFWVL